MSKTRTTSKPHAGCQEQLRRETLRGDAQWQVLRDLIEQRRYVTVPKVTQDARAGNAHDRRRSPWHWLQATLHRLDSPTGGYILITGAKTRDQGNLWEVVLLTVAHLEDWMSEQQRMLQHRDLRDAETNLWAELYFGVRREYNDYHEKAKAGSAVANG